MQIPPQHEGLYRAGLPPQTFCQAANSAGLLEVAGAFDDTIAQALQLVAQF
jgi:hypothetical protein